MSSEVREEGEEERILAGSEIEEAKGASREEKLKTAAPLIPFC